MTREDIDAPDSIHARDGKWRGCRRLGREGSGGGPETGMKTRYVIATALYCAGIFWISSQPRPLGVDLPSAFEIDKFLHFGVYAGLAGVVSVGLQRSESRLSRRWQFWFPIVFAALYGLSDETHQIFVPSRTFAIGDLVANTAGGIAAQCFLWYAWWRPRQGDAASATEHE